jgi:hypothetical protein
MYLTSRGCDINLLCTYASVQLHYPRKGILILIELDFSPSLSLSLSLLASPLVGEEIYLASRK